MAHVNATILLLHETWFKIFTLSHKFTFVAYLVTYT